MKKWLKWAGWGLLGLFILAGGIGAGYEALSRNRAPRDFPPAGARVDVGGRSLQLDCRGQGAPVVVLESGLDTLGALSWAAVHDAIAATARTCAYSRAGILWSDPRGAPASGKAIAEDLHAALKGAGEPGPFVLVGHSLGGPLVMIFTRHFPDQVAGLVFVDASHPDQMARLASLPQLDPGAKLPLYQALDALAWTGALRALSGMEEERLPNESELVARTAAAYITGSFAGMLTELEALKTILAEAGEARQLGDRPLFVLTAAAPFAPPDLAALQMTPEQGRDMQRIWQALQDDEATWSTRSQHRLLADAQHYVQFYRPDAVIDAVRSVVASVRGR